MEAFGGVTSVIAVTTIALQSSKAVYATINGFKNGRKEVKNLASALNCLSHILEQVTEISNTFSGMDGTDITGLEQVMKECARNLADFRKQVEKLGVSSDERKIGKAWKRVKTVMQEEDFRKMRVTVDYFINVFGTHLSLIGRQAV